MLNSVFIQNIVLIEKLEIQMAKGLCILSGETGSGKSILLDALGLAIGSRSNSRLLRQGAKQGMVVAEFNIKNNTACQEILKENGLANQENPNILTLRRILLDNATSKAFANDVPIGVNLLSQIGYCLIEIHGQHEQRGLLNSSFHKDILDSYARSEELLKSVNVAFDDWREIENKITKINEDKDKNERERDYLEHVVKELEEAGIEVGEEESLTEKRNLLLNKEKIINLTNEISSDINDADTKLSSAQKSLIRNQSLGSLVEGSEENGFEQLIEIIDQIAAKSDEARFILDQIYNSFDKNDLNIDEIEERLFLIRSLSRKLNTPIDQLPEFLETTKDKLRIVENYQELACELESKKKIAQEEYLQKARNLSSTRKEAALRLSKIVENELSHLKMGSVKFQAQITQLNQDHYNRDGIDSVKFVAATNQNSVLDEISKIASGGELSRFMLALKVALLEVKSVPILIFDEIDSGIGGGTADAVGRRLKVLSKKLQIMVVTHHAQVASKADYHLRINKNNSDGVTNTFVKTLDKEEREEEVARMLSGEKVSDEAMAAAKKLIAASA